MNLPYPPTSPISWRLPSSSAFATPGFESLLPHIDPCSCSPTVDIICPPYRPRGKPPSSPLLSAMNIHSIYQLSPSTMTSVRTCAITLQRKAISPQAIQPPNSSTGFRCRHLLQPSHAADLPPCAARSTVSPAPDSEHPTPITRSALRLYNTISASLLAPFSSNKIQLRYSRRISLLAHSPHEIVIGRSLSRHSTISPIRSRRPTRHQPQPTQTHSICS